jgi:small subunit ribosomal protein S4
VRRLEAAGAIVEALNSTGGRRTPEWLSLDVAAMSAKVNAVPVREQIDTQVEEALIVEFYSR